MRQAWGKGYATQAAQLALAYGLATLRLAEIACFTTSANARSRRLMEWLAMRRDAGDDFDHPAAPGHPQQPHVLYRLSRDDYLARQPPP